MSVIGPWRRARPGVALVGVVVLVAGTFAPWVASGATIRSLYGAAGAGGGLLRLNRAASGALAALPFVSLASAMALLLWIAGRADIAAVLMLVLDAATAVGASATLFAPHTGPVHAVDVGPIVSISGALINFAAILARPSWNVVRRSAIRSAAGPIDTAPPDLARSKDAP